MRDLIKHSESREGFRPPADVAAFAMRARLANETKHEKRLPRWMLAFACCFAIGVWLAALFMLSPSALQFARQSEEAIAHWSGARPVKAIVQRPSSAPVKSSALANCKTGSAGHHGYAQADLSCEALPRRFRSSLR